MVHTWSNPTDQLPVEEDPPTFLRGWNHVHVDAEGCLFVIVPLCSLLKLSPGSELLWRADLAAHHDLDVSAGGKIHLLTETPRLVGAQVVLDNEIVVLGPSGAQLRSYSLYEIVRTDPALHVLVDTRLASQHAEFVRSGTLVDEETRELLKTGQVTGSLRRALQLLRQIPGSPCDVLHANTVSVIDAHPDGLWKAGDILVSLRNLDTIAVIDPWAGQVVWSWGPGVLSGQHQPSMLPDGRILVFDNGVRERQSRLLEVDPCSNQVTWEYTADGFFSELAGGCEQLPNGNILVTQAQTGKGFEITRSGVVVWSWESPPTVGGMRTSRVSIYRLSAVPATVASRLVTRRR
ncbi:MAG: arylsulfotransferase family protein [Pseudonocardiaceae bacterium]